MTFTTAPIDSLKVSPKVRTEENTFRRLSCSGAATGRRYAS